MLQFWGGCILVVDSTENTPSSFWSYAIAAAHPREQLRLSWSRPKSSIVHGEHHIILPGSNSSRSGRYTVVAAIIPRAAGLAFWLSIGPARTLSTALLQLPQSPCNSSKAWADSFLSEQRARTDHACWPPFSGKDWEIALVPADLWDFPRDLK